MCRAPLALAVVMEEERASDRARAVPGRSVLLRRTVATALLTLWLPFSTAWAGSLADGERCLAAHDLVCAEGVLAELEVEGSTDPRLLRFAARTHFYAGRYPEAIDTLTAAKDAGYPGADSDIALYERTMFATAGWTEAKRGRARIRYLPGADAILVDDAAKVVERSARYLEPLLGPPLDGDTLVEIFPDGRSFTAASSLSKADVQTTGVVAISKWTRLLITSPRALGRGYPWQDTVAHEYIHLIVARNTDDQAPVWLQEAVAKYLDGRWRDGSDRFNLSPRQRYLLGSALAKDKLVSFEKMHPSLAKLDTADEAALAYAQLASLMEYCFDEGGQDVLLRALPKVRDGVDPRVALAEAAGFDEFDKLMEAWEAWVRTQDLSGSEVAELPTNLDPASEFENDPILEHREDLRRFTRLGDLLLERERPKAALVEYNKGIPEDEPSSPLLSNRIAQAHLALGDTSAARRALEGSLVDYPEFALSHKTLGEILAVQGHTRPALEAYLEAAALNPFDNAVQTAIAGLYAKLGDTGGQARHEGYLEILRTGGAHLAVEVIHDRFGDYEMPGDAHDSGRARKRGDPSKFVGEAAPGFVVETLDGVELDLAELEGKVVVVDFWATWCGPCKVAIPHLAELSAKHGEAGLVVVGISDESRARVKPFVKKMEIPYTIATDLSRTAHDAYEISGLPTAFVIGRDGVVVAGFRGWSEGIGAELTEAVEGAL